MKPIFSIAFLTVLTVLFSCTKNTSHETIQHDTIPKNIVSVDSVKTEEVKPEPALIISDSAGNALSSLVDSKFETVFKALADSANYYKVVLIDYYDEYEGQDEMKKYTWYFDKEMSIVYSKYSYQNGAMEKPDIAEYISLNALVTNSKEIWFSNSDTKFFSMWDVQSGGVKIKWSEYFKRVESVEPLPTDHANSIQNAWEVNLNTLKDFIESEEPESNTDIYSIVKRVPKPSELVDYTEVSIPKAVYDKLKQ